MRALIPGAACGVIACLWVGCSDPGGPYFGHVPEPDPTHLTICNIGNPETVDPAFAVSGPDMKIVYELFDGLTTFDPQALPVPSLATSWEITPGHSRFVFHLRPTARWSNGRPLVAEDFVYSFARLLHPLTASPNADAMLHLRHAKEYNAGTARMVLADAGPFRAGQVVVSVDPVPGGGDKTAPGAGPNLRVARAATPLRAGPSADAETWATAPAGAELTVIERRCLPDGCWAYLHLPGDEGRYGWAPLAVLDAPNDDRPYPVRAAGGTAEGTVRGRDLLMLPEVLGVSAPDPHTLVLETEGPTPYLLSLTLQRAFRPVPREAASRWPRTWTRPEHIVSSGPFHLAELRLRDKVELTRSPTFWDAEHVRLGRVTFLSIESQAVAANIYYQGSCDALMANALPLSYIQVVADKRDYRVAAYLGITSLIINTRRFPNLHFRRALARSIDRTAIVRMLGWSQGSALQYVPGTPVEELTPAERTLCKLLPDAQGVALIVEKDRLCYVPPMAPSFDLVAARHELELALAELGDRLPTRLTYLYFGGMAQHKMVGEWLQAEWRQNLGIELDLQPLDWKTFLDTTLQGRFDVARLGWLGSFPDPESEYVGMFKCGTASNRTFFCDPDVDHLLAQAEIEADPNRRLDLVKAAEARIVDAAPIVPLYRILQDQLHKPYVRDLYVNLTDNQSLRATWIDPDWRSR